MEPVGKAVCGQTPHLFFKCKLKTLCEKAVHLRQIFLPVFETEWMRKWDCMHQEE